MRYLKLTFAYDGTDYIGWQVQPNGRSIQGELESAWEQITGEQLRITASGRTDSGVHALGQVCSLATATNLDCATIRRAVNAVLPKDICVLDVGDAEGDFHAIRDCVGKTYRYQIQAGRLIDVFARRFHWHIPVPLAVDPMRLAANRLLGRHDFAGFQAAGSKRLTTVRTISDVSITESNRDSFQYLAIEVTADGFLYNMMRCIAGSLALIGQGKKDPDWLGGAIASRDRALAGPTAPPHGLFLVAVQHSSKGTNVDDDDV